MPRMQTSVLNRAAAGRLAAGEGLPDINASYSRRIDIADGVSLTGFVASVLIAQANVTPRNELQVFLYENAGIDLSVGLLNLPDNSRLLIRYDVPFATETIHLSERFDRPYQLRYGQDYLLLARLLLYPGVVVVPVEIYLTALGYENEQRSPDRIYLR